MMYEWRFAFKGSDQVIKYNTVKSDPGLKYRLIYTMHLIIFFEIIFSSIYLLNFFSSDISTFTKYISDQYSNWVVSGIL